LTSRAAQDAPRFRSTRILEIAVIRFALIGAVVAAFTMPAAAHVTLETQEAKIGEPYKAVLRVPRCASSDRPLPSSFLRLGAWTARY
jgi:hypothetical protein